MFFVVLFEIKTKEKIPEIPSLQTFSKIAKNTKKCEKFEFIKKKNEIHVRIHIFHKEKIFFGFFLVVDGLYLPRNYFPSNLVLIIGESFANHASLNKSLM